MSTRSSQTISRPPFLVDLNTEERDTGRQVAWEEVPQSFQHNAQTVNLDAAVAAEDTEMTVAALDEAIPAGSQIYFGDAVVTTSAAAEAGATEVSIYAAGAAIADDSDGTVIPLAGTGKFIPAGTAMALAADGKRVIPRTGDDAAFCLLVSNAYEHADHVAASGYGVFTAGRFYENLLPDYTNAAWATIKTELGSAFRFQMYEDNRTAE